MSENTSTVKNFLLYGGVTREERRQLKPLIIASNLRTWRVASIILEILFLAIFIISMVSNEFHGFAPYFGALAA